MRAAVVEKSQALKNARDRGDEFVRLVDIPTPRLSENTSGPRFVLLKVRACGVCRTDLHIVEGEPPPLRDQVVPGHQNCG